jgi:hypothetical protein
MAGDLPSSMSYAMTKALPSLSSIQGLIGSSEASLIRVGVAEVEVGRKTKKHSYFQ